MDLEKRILKLIERDARLSAKTIAAMIDEDEEKVQEIISGLEKNRTILGYHAIVNWEKNGWDGVTALIEVKVSPEREVGFNNIAERIYRFPEVKSVYLMSGSYDLSVIVEGDSLKDVARFVSHKLSVIDQVQSTVTHFILKRYKEDHIIFNEGEEDKRLVVSP
ncbi:Transcription regulator AsnC-type [Syntrophomonas zehnderi OL-4]|uniref:Transcription regulator AsnC-type n=1 Tax=Syntrophomonas zehnderi OL-4 TaxID=690567 RepID=A0A0E4GBH0_9FIRM|nr:Lrp/AsnC family transcriptional regulator [Syntrophomonas zehnderi]CFX69429.1 Transcription regulator AsnC-type [Syntrophomonas zehnderi OL-4]